MENAVALIALGVNAERQPEIIGCEGGKEDTQSWLNLLQHLKERELRGTRLFAEDQCLGLVEATRAVYPESKYQRRIVHFYRNMFPTIPKKHMPEAMAMFKAIHAQEDREAAPRRAWKQRKEKLPGAEKQLEEELEETLTYTQFPHKSERNT